MPRKPRANSVAGRFAHAKESFKTAAECIGDIEKGKHLFAITRGQFSMVDAVLHTLDQVGPAKLSLWTWTIAEYEILNFTRLREDGRVTAGRLVIDEGARNKNKALIQDWQRSYGPESVRYVLNHAKVATVEGNGFKVLLRGSMNLNHNPRFENLDVSEGCPGFDLVREIEDGLPILPDSCTGADAYKASSVAKAFDSETLDMFKKLKKQRRFKPWSK